MAGVLHLMEYRSPKLTVDGVVIRNGKILLIKRKNEPFKNRWALPGGFVEYGEAVESAVLREVAEETGLETEITHLVGVYSDPDRDPRGHTVSIAYILSPKDEKEPSGGDDASEAKFFDVNELPPLAFDHDKIIKDAMHILKHGMR